MPIRILHVVDNMLGMGGMEKNIINLIQRMDPERFEHVVCVIRRVGALADDIPRNRGTLICLDKTQDGRSFLGWTLARQIARVQPDIVHSRNWGAIEAILAGRCAPACALVHSEHGMDAGSAGFQPWRRRMMRGMAFYLADQVFSVSCALRDFYARNTGFPARRIAVIHNGVDTERFYPQDTGRRRVRERLEIGPGEFCIGAVGRLETVKDLPTLVRAAAVAAKKWRLLFAGDGSEACALQSLVSRFPELHERTSFLGEIHDIPEFLNALDVYVLPSIYEGISNSLLEAMATGLPVIASAVGGNTEVIVDGDSGLLFPAGDTAALASRLTAVFERPEFRARLGQRGLARVKENFSLNSMVQKYEDLYSSLT
jgi:sugar transferase (PEP-CTERM/EpsH1 system associated)